MNRRTSHGSQIPFLAGCLALLLSLVLLPGCSDDNPTDPGAAGASGTLVSHGECKFTSTSSALDDTPPNQDCIYYDYDDNGTLNLIHVNGAFNCCPEEIYAVITIEDGSITIEEYETEGLCNCICLYDVEYLIEDLPPGSYHLTVVGCSLPASEPPLECQLDLIGSPSGECCIERQGCPWVG